MKFLDVWFRNFLKILDFMGTSLEKDGWFPCDHDSENSRGVACTLDVIAISARTSKYNYSVFGPLRLVFKLDLTDEKSGSECVES